MPEPVEKAAIAPAPTDAELDIAADLEGEEPEKIVEPSIAPAEVVPPELPPVVPAKDDEPPEHPDNAERSRLGRRVAGIERQMSELVDSLNRFTQVNMNMRKPEESAPEEIDEDMPITRREAEVLFEQRERAKVEQANNYFNSYVSAVYNLGKADDAKLFEEVAKELDDTVTYGKYSNDPGRDAELNYYKASKEVMRRKLVAKVEPVNPLDKNKGAKNQATGVGGEVRANVREIPVPQLDESAKEYLSYLGKRGVSFSEDELRDTLTKAVPPTGKKDMRGV